MFNVTPLASEYVAKYFEGRTKTPVRIYFNAGGWGPPSLAMALDEPGERDARFEVDGFTYVIEENLLARVQPVTVDFKANGFHITAKMEAMARMGLC